MPKICDMEGVREYAEKYSVELVRDDDNGRLVVRAINEGGHNCTEVDLLDLIAWFAGAGRGMLQAYGVDAALGQQIRR